MIIQVTQEQKELWVKQAHMELVTLSEWLRRAADARLTGGEAGRSPGRAETPGHVAQDGSRASLPASPERHDAPIVEESPEKVEKVKPVKKRGGYQPTGLERPTGPPPKCSKQGFHHIYHSGKPCPVCGYPNEGL